jgi:hypothetical protein
MFLWLDTTSEGSTSGDTQSPLRSVGAPCDVGGMREMRMRILLSMTVTVSLVLFVSYAQTETYTWTDSNGTTSFTDDPPKNAQRGLSKTTTSKSGEAHNINNSDLIGSWTNGETGFAKMGFYLAEGGRGFYTSGEII